MRWKGISYEILVYKSKLSQLETSTMTMLLLFRALNFLRKQVYVDKGTLRIFDIFY